MAKIIISSKRKKKLILRLSLVSIILICIIIAIFAEVPKVLEEKGYVDWVNANLKR